MTGKGHLIFGLCAGTFVATLLKMPITPTTVSVGVASIAVASLAPDLDEPNSILGQKLSLPPHVLKSILIVVGLLIIGGAYFTGGLTGGLAMLAGAGTFFVSYMLKSKSARGIVLALVGATFVGIGLLKGWYWMVALGIFVGVAPWTPHRSVTHTIWAVALWYYIGQGFEQTVGIEGMKWIITAAYASHLVADSLTKARVKWFLGVYNKEIGIPLIRVGTGGGMEAVVNAICVVATIMFFVSQ